MSKLIFVIMGHIDVSTYETWRGPCHVRPARKFLHAGHLPRYYVRVSTQDQNLELQLDALLAEGVDADHIYEEKASGKKDDRPVWPRASSRCARAMRWSFTSSTGLAAI